ncbi:cystathionine beta-lyase [Melghiribacillus thermohalophilus]|uniref:cysteine-S-conjugate beta-lyase n=1 Tax=Melghiribacillus thermohalophilus TaxID=1324956 RepID=A0A4R3MQ35_9BACI|nr:PatB family C-S lyase [Melghiribacillus thermohalophilus]TCT15102.1 cystathionine beta-lyase [Melghiribacillus thermohalophilus]
MEQFQQIIDRTGTRSVKWDLREKIFKRKDVLPMWVADMDFYTADAVKDAIMKRAEHHIYGYTATDESVAEAIQQWLKKRHGWNIDQQWLTYSPGVVTSLHILVQSLTEQGDQVMIQTPVYPPFYSAVNHHNRTLVKNPLKLVNGRYEIDFEDFEARLKNGVKLFILCSPHNPVGRVWTKQELRNMAELCIQYGATIVSDEIHGDLIYEGYEHIPVASLSDEISQHVVTCMSPSKTFNLAGLQASYLITREENLKKKIDKGFKKQGMGMLNTFGVTALEAAYLHGEPWLEELLSVLEDHKQYVMDSFHHKTDQIQVIQPEGTYLLWLDCRKMGMGQEKLNQFMIEHARVGLNDGASFGDEGNGFMRMNIACPKKTVEEGVYRIIQALNSYDKKDGE